MINPVKITDSVSFNHFYTVAEKSNKDEILTLSTNGKKMCLTSGRSLGDRFIIALHNSSLKNIGFIKELHEKLEDRDKEAVNEFRNAIAKVYSEDHKNIINIYLDVSKKQLTTSEVKFIAGKIIRDIHEDICKEYIEKDKNLESLLKHNGFGDFDISQLNNSDFNLLSKTYQDVDKIVTAVTNKKSSSKKFESALKSAVMNFVTAMPAPSHVFMNIVAGKASPEAIATGPKYDINKINIYGPSDPNFTSEDLNQILIEAGRLKAQLIDSHDPNQCRHQLYADNFRKVNMMPPRVHTDAAASGNIVPPPQPPSSSQIHTDVAATSQLPESDQPHRINPAALQNTQMRQAITGSGTANVNNSEQDRKPDITVPGNMASPPPPPPLPQVNTDAAATSQLPKNEQPQQSPFVNIVNSQEWKDAKKNLKPVPKNPDTNKENDLTMALNNRRRTRRPSSENLDGCKPGAGYSNQNPILAFLGHKIDQLSLTDDQNISAKIYNNESENNIQWDD
ncbi:hypothetical protein [Morganella morganii]|uniref:hypothetical protein n=1 Tax=Morganella morganii TaxID=582 RepID=UPI00046AF591|nr:hypothetical protein [Morganella morganii]